MTLLPFVLSLLLPKLEPWRLMVEVCTTPHHARARAKQGALTTLFFF
jgi:hypothetical protein